MYMRKEVIVYETLNKLVPENKLFHGFFWSNYANKDMQKCIQNIQDKYRFPGLQAIEITEKAQHLLSRRLRFIAGSAGASPSC